MKAISKHRIIGPYWFEDKNEKAQMLCGSSGHHSDDCDKHWFQQDRVTEAHLFGTTTSDFGAARFVMDLFVVAQYPFFR